MLLRRISLFLLICAAAAAIPVSAADTQAAYCFSPDDFSSGEQVLQGVYVTDLSGTDCTLRCGSRQICAGDVLTAEQLSALEVTNLSEAPSVAAVAYLPVYSDGVGSEETLYVSLRGTKNQPPETADSSTETYKNLPVTEALSCSDPEGGALTYQLVKKPRRGEVTLNADGTFTYTPEKEKVGTDSFTYVASDSEGAVSAEARVTIEIKKAISSGVFADMTGDPNEREALFLRCSGLFSGETVAETLFFRPDRTVSREDFLMMTMKLCGLEPEETEETGWFAPWQAAALRAGLNADTEGDFTKLDAAMMTAGLLDLPADASVTVFGSVEDSTAAQCLAALEQAGLDCFTENAEAVMTRRDAAKMLYELSRYCEEENVSFPWDE